MFKRQEKTAPAHQQERHVLGMARLAVLNATLNQGQPASSSSAIGTFPQQGSSTNRHVRHGIPIDGSNDHPAMDTFNKKHSSVIHKPTVDFPRKFKPHISKK